MLENWKTYKLGELGSIARGKSKHRPRDASHLYGGEYPFIQTGDVKAANHRLNKHTQTYSNAGLAQSKLWPKNTMCITIAANIAETALLDYPACFPDSIIGFVANESICDIEFVEYLMQYFKKQIQSHSIGSVQDNINLGTFERVEFKVPPLKEQIAIASILSSLDDKIEINLQMNKTLEEMAMALYKHWFVDFGPFQKGEFVDSKLGMIPKGWEVKSIYDLADYINGAAFKPSDFGEDGLYVIKIAELKSGITNNTNRSQKKVKESLVINDGSVLFSWSATLDIFLWDKGHALLNQHIFNVMPNGVLPKEVLYFLLKNVISYFQAIAADRATTMGHIKLSHLKETLLAIPNSENVKSIDSNFKNLFEQILSNLQENQTLTKLRDTLLPKLISGEVRVKDAEKLITSAL